LTKAPFVPTDTQAPKGNHAAPADLASAAGKSSPPVRDFRQPSRSVTTC